MICLMENAFSVNRMTIALAKNLVNVVLILYAMHVLKILIVEQGASVGQEYVVAYLIHLAFIRALN